MTDSFSAAFAELRREYLAEAPARLTELRKDADAFRAGEPGARESLRMRFHRLAGSGGSYGFPQISTIAREMEQWIVAGAGPEAADRLDAAIDRLSAAFDAAYTELGVASGMRAAEFAGEAVLLASAGPLFDRLYDLLRTLGLALRVLPVTATPADRPSERPDLLVIAAEPADGDPTAVAAAWTASQAGRPRAVAVVESGRAVDRLRAVAAGVDAVIPADELEVELPRFARTLARVGTPPPKVLVVELVDGGPAAALEQSAFRVAAVRGAEALPEVMEREGPDVVLLAVDRPDDEVLAVVRLIRMDPRYRFLPVLATARTVTPDEQVAALRAGLDDLFTGAIDLRVLLQAVASRAERGRRLQEAVHRDPLTGLLNHATISAELDSAVAYGRRHGEPVVFMVLDIDHFRRVNDRFGDGTGDQVLVQLGDRFRSAVRASDLVGRYDGDAFALVLRGGGAAGAMQLAAKLRGMVRELPPVGRDGTPIPLTLSVGWAGFPGDGDTGPALERAADRALFRAKTGGRDRVEGGG